MLAYFTVTTRCYQCLFWIWPKGLGPRSPPDVITAKTSNPRSPTEGHFTKLFQRTKTHLKGLLPQLPFGDHPGVHRVTRYPAAGRRTSGDVVGTKRKKKDSHCNFFDKEKSQIRTLCDASGTERGRETAHRIVRYRRHPIADRFRGFYGAKIKILYDFFRLFVPDDDLLMTWARRSNLTV